jgi:hypothetical protein
MSDAGFIPLNVEEVARSPDSADCGWTFATGAARKAPSPPAPRAKGANRGAL